MSKSRLRHVAVLIESSRAYGRGLIEGVVRYSREHKNWRIDYEPRGLEAPPRWLDRWSGDGILARLPSQRFAQAVSAKGLPVVELYFTSKNTQPPVAGDNVKIAQLAFEHFWERGIRQFGYCGLHRATNRQNAERGDAFAALAKSAGCRFIDFPAARNSMAVSNWDQDQADLATWVKKLPKPIGVLACFDERGFQLLNACRDIGIQVPEQITVMSVGNDSLLCEMCMPPLSSIELDAPRIGFEAAALLDRLMDGEDPDTIPPLFIEPRRLVARRSSDILMVDDADVAAALKLIRERACDGIRVADVLQEIHVSRSVLERKFKQFVGRTPKAQILRVQMDCARQLILESDMSISDIAKRSGFASEKYFSDAFQCQVGVRPAAMRKEHPYIKENS